MSILEELDFQHRVEASTAIASGFVRIVEENGRPHVYQAYSEAGKKGGWGARFGPFQDEDEAQAFIEAGSFIACYRSGHGVWKVGNRVRYVGKNSGKTVKYVEDVAIGTEGTVTKDCGFDSRYVIEFDKPTAFHIWSSHPEGEYQDRTGMRTGGSGWERIFA